MKIPEEDKELLRKEFKLSTKTKSPYGGQHTGVSPREVVLTSESLNVEIIIGYTRSQHTNRELAVKLFNHLLDIIE